MSIKIIIFLESGSISNMDDELLVLSRECLREQKLHLLDRMKLLDNEHDERIKERFMIFRVKFLPFFHIFALDFNM